MSEPVFSYFNVLLIMPLNNCLFHVSGSQNGKLPPLPRGPESNGSVRHLFAHVIPLCHLFVTHIPISN